MRAKIYAQLMEVAQERIAHTLYKRGVSHDDVLAALDAVDEEMSEAQRREDLYLSALEHYVGALVAGSRFEPCLARTRSLFGGRLTSTTHS